MSDQRIEQRIAALEASLEEIKKLKGVPGPRMVYLSSTSIN